MYRGAGWRRDSEPRTGGPTLQRVALRLTGRAERRAAPTQSIGRTRARRPPKPPCSTIERRTQGRRGRALPRAPALPGARHDAEIRRLAGLGRGRRGVCLAPAAPVPAGARSGRGLAAGRRPQRRLPAASHQPAGTLSRGQAAPAARRHQRGAAQQAGTTAHRSTRGSRSKPGTCSAGLRWHQRTVLTLQLGGYRYNEIAERLGRPTPTESHPELERSPALSRRCRAAPCRPPSPSRGSQSRWPRR
jgi:hypothetical protein